MFRGIQAEAGQVTTVRLGDQAFLVQAGDRRLGPVGGVVMYLDAFLHVIQIVQRENFHLGNQFGGVGHRDSGFLLWGQSAV
ncbi:hypothetical protein D3C84_1012600 [compost metagenome]